MGRGPDLLVRPTTKTDQQRLPHAGFLVHSEQIAARAQSDQTPRGEFAEKAID